MAVWATSSSLPMSPARRASPTCRSKSFTRSAMRARTSSVSRCGHRFARPHVVIPLPWRVDQQEAEWLRLAQIADLVLAARRHGTERPLRHRHHACALWSLVVDLATASDHEEQVPAPGVQMRRKLLAGVHAEQARLGLGHLMQHGLRAGAM